MSATDRDDLIALVAAVNGAGALDATAKLDYLGADAPAASVQQLPGAVWSERYVDGSGRKAIPFAVLYRVAQGDTAHRADAATALRALGELDGITIEQSPAITERNESTRSEVWRASYILEAVRSA